MLARLRHDAVITGDHQQSVIDTAYARQHVREEFFMPRHIDKAQHTTIRLRPIGVAQIDSHPAFFLFRQAIGIDPGNRLEQRRFTVVYVSGSCNNHFSIISINRLSSSRQRISSHKRPS